MPKNRLFTNAKEPADDAVRGAPNPFTHLPRQIRFERRFQRVEPPEPLRAPAIHYRYGLDPIDAGWAAWCSGGRPTGRHGMRYRSAGSATAPVAKCPFGMRTANANVRVDYEGPPLAKDFAVKLVLHACRAIQTVTVMEALRQSVVRRVVPAGARRRESGAGRRGPAAQAPAGRDLARPADRRADRCAGHSRHLALGRRTRRERGCELSPADKWVVAGELTVSPEPARSGHSLSGHLCRVRSLKQSRAALSAPRFPGSRPGDALGATFARTTAKSHQASAC